MSGTIGHTYCYNKAINKRETQETLETKIMAGNQLLKGNFIMTNMAIIYVNDNTARVTKAFQKNACIFGTEEFKLWREYKKEFPDAKMQTKSIKKNPDKKSNRNMTYPNMKKFISTLSDKDKLLKEFEAVKKRSLIQAYPYGYVLEWFQTTIEGYDDFAKFCEYEQQSKGEDDASTVKE